LEKAQEFEKNGAILQVAIVSNAHSRATSKKSADGCLWLDRRFENRHFTQIFGLSSNLVPREMSLGG
jgi:hypothetical protein